MTVTTFRRTRTGGPTFTVYYKQDEEWDREIWKWSWRGDRRTEPPDVADKLEFHSKGRVGRGGKREKGSQVKFPRDVTGGG